MKGNMRDLPESLARPLGDLQDFPSVPKSLCDFLWVVLTHRKLFLATQRPWSWARGRVAMRTMFQTKCFWGRWVETQRGIPNKALLDLEGKLRLSKATVLVASLGCKLNLNKVNRCCIIIISFLDILQHLEYLKRNWKRSTISYNRKPYPNIHWHWLVGVWAYQLNIVQFHKWDIGSGASWWGPQSIFGSDKFHGEQQFQGRNDEASSHCQWSSFLLGRGPLLRMACTSPFFNHCICHYHLCTPFSQDIH